MDDYTTPLWSTTVGIVVLVDQRDDETTLNFDEFDCGRGVQNLKLAATDIRLGTVHRASAMARPPDLLDVPSDKRVPIILALGHPADDQEDRIEGREKSTVLHETGRRSLDDIVHWETHA